MLIHDVVSSGWPSFMRALSQLGLRLMLVNGAAKNSTKRFPLRRWLVNGAVRL
jgi:hypothetical protein